MVYGVVGWFPTAVRIRLSQPPAGLGLGLGLSLAKVISYNFKNLIVMLTLSVELN